MATRLDSADGNFKFLRHVDPNDFAPGLVDAKVQTSSVQELICTKRMHLREGIGVPTRNQNAIEELEELLTKLENGARITEISRSN